MGMTKMKERKDRLMPAAKSIADFKIPVSRQKLMWVIKSFNLFALTKNESRELNITKRFQKLTTLFQIRISTVSAPQIAF